MKKSELYDKIRSLDTHNVYESIQLLPKQITQVISDVAKLKFPNTYKNCDLIAISGMGGSIYNYTVILTLFEDSLKKPIVQVNGYTLPKRIVKDTLFIASSYSGTTEETIMTTRLAIKNDDTITAVTSGGELGLLMKKNKLPVYIFDPMHNPSGQPRIGVGYTIFAPILILAKLGYLDFSETQLKNAIKKLEKLDETLQKKALSICTDIQDKQVIFITSEHLEGNAHIARNQLNETAKTYAEYHMIPELNHHLLEGLTYPKKMPLHFICMPSPFFHERNKKRMDITQKVIKKQGFDYCELVVPAENKLEEFLLLLQVNSYMSFYRGIASDIDPSEIPWVNYFKKELQNV